MTPLKKTLTPSSLTLVLMQSKIPLYFRPPAPDIWRRAFPTSMGVAKAQDNTPATHQLSLLQTNLRRDEAVFEKRQSERNNPSNFTVTFETDLAVYPSLLDPGESTRKARNRTHSSACLWEQEPCPLWTDPSVLPSSRSQQRSEKTRDNGQQLFDPADAL